MNFKVNAPGCPCDCSETPPTGPCGCDATQIQIDVTDADDIISIHGVRFTGGPCTTMDFTGFSDINGTYYVDMPSDSNEIELGRWKATNGPLSDVLGTKYCVYVKLKFIPAITTPGEMACGGVLCLCINVETLFDTSVCPALETYPFIQSCLFLACGIFGETNDIHISLCIPESRTISQPTTDDTDCPIIYYDWTATWAPV